MDLQFDQLLMFGDSITEYAYEAQPLGPGTAAQFTAGAALQSAYTRRLDVVQRGFSGYNTVWALQLLPKILEHSSRIKLATLFFGTNDSVLGGFQRVPLPQFKENSRRLIQMLKDKGIAVVVIGPAKHDAANWEIGRAKEVAAGVIRTNENNAAYSQVLKELAVQMDVAFADLYKAFDSYEGGDWRHLLGDGVHFTGEGYRIMFDVVMEQIRLKYPQWSPEQVPYKMPSWQDMETLGDNYIV